MTVDPDSCSLSVSVWMWVCQREAMCGGGRVKSTLCCSHVHCGRLAMHCFLAAIKREKELKDTVTLIALMTMSVSRVWMMVVVVVVTRVVGMG